MRSSPPATRAAVMQAETPQIETPLDRIIADRSSTPWRRAKRKANIQTTATTRQACTRPKTPDFITSLKRIVAPRQTTPILMKNSPWMAGFIQSGTCHRLRIARPKITEKKTDSNPYSATTGILATTCARSDVAKTTTSEGSMPRRRRPMTAQPA